MFPSHVIAFDDFPFEPGYRGNVTVVGVVFAGLRLEGVVRGRIRRDGANSTETLLDLIRRSKFGKQLQLVMLQGIALGGFNVVDLERLHGGSGLPVLVLTRRRPRLERVRSALLNRVAGGARKWKLIERIGPMEPLAGLYAHRRGIGRKDAESLIERLSVHSRIPEPLRTAHLIAGGLGSGESRGRP